MSARPSFVSLTAPKMDDADPRVRLTMPKEFGEWGGVNNSIEVSTTFTVLEPATLQDIFQGQRGPQHGCYLYGRSFNPTVRALGRQLAALEGTEAAYACSSGMAAISSTLMALCNAGDHVVASNTVYGGTYALLKSFLPQKCNITTTFVPIHNLSAVAAAITDKTKVIYTETVSNPTLVVADLPNLAALARARGITLVVDNTFTPFIISPARHGAHVVVHSMTKFMSGASDIVAGAVCGSTSFIQSLMDLHTGSLMLLGPTMDPKIASELSLRLPHLSLRMQEHCRRASFMATQLHTLGAQVTYPGLPHHPQHDLMAALANPGYGFGGLFGVDLGQADHANAFMQRLQNKHGFGYMAVSLGYFDTLMSLSGSSTSSEMTDNDKAAAGISPGYVRVSVGITGSLEQRWSQLQESYEFVQRVGGNAPFRAVKGRRGADGQVTPLLSWPSEGSLASLLPAEDLLPLPEDLLAPEPSAVAATADMAVAPTSAVASGDEEGDAWDPEVAAALPEVFAADVQAQEEARLRVCASMTRPRAGSSAGAGQERQGAKRAAGVLGGEGSPDAEGAAAKRRVVAGAPVPATAVREGEEEEAIVIVYHPRVAGQI
mmetsp:Transcript_38185/g.85103  ORF Transcript_38185/g.85103 Transcript_38185/m.85103 type:complete len:603 (+) Transcript_38185:88-1896(+)